MSLTNNVAQRRYELALDGGDIAFALYREAPGALVVTHTETPAHLRGQGVGSRLVAGMLDDIRARGLKVTPRCGFVRAFIACHPEYRDLVE